jgi:hypothetical protein
MKWNKLEYGKWPKGRIVMRIVSDNGYVNHEIGWIEIFIDNTSHFFIENKEGIHTILNIDSIYDSEPHYIELDNLEMPS